MVLVVRMEKSANIFYHFYIYKIFIEVEDSFHICTTLQFFYITGCTSVIIFYIEAWISQLPYIEGKTLM